MLDMRLILDLDDKLVSDMQDYCEYHGITINHLIENLFNRFVREPAISFSEVDEEKDFWDFVFLLENYLKEAKHDIEMLSKSSEAFDTDKAMAKVFERLIEKHLRYGFVILDLYETYKKEMGAAK